ncbi:2-amino-4-hydroxy-6-hydroxymethyldihydropteridine diphosphokinase [Microvirga sp. W0021]|uniref:2-amino-4-hydroxy-6-hydroxymethyldihydropteridine pyrophosphokinase n=1 Tax=Hohaiivirga grylli TaxID=3133970 RepID=A0ABV0BGQ3_9HYPH
MCTAYLGLGSNMGDKAANIFEARNRLNDTDGISVSQVSHLYRTAPWGNTDQDWFINACLRIETTLEAHQLLTSCLDIEHAMGRKRLQKWGPRLIDIDVLVYEGMELESERLTLPHPYILNRSFVLAPLSEIAPDLCIKGEMVSTALARLDTSDISIFKC